jgi:hypothetical protein
MSENNVNECLNCGFYDEDFGCTLSSMDKWYACPLEADEEELGRILDNERTDKEVGSAEFAEQNQSCLMA